MKELTYARAAALLTYNKESGALTRAKRLSNSVTVGEIAGSLHQKGYIYLYVDGRRYLAHRVAWLLETGSWPLAQIDHIDGNRANNRWLNLREVSNQQNAENKRAASSNTSGLLGVSWMSQAGKWRAQICCDGNVKYLGLFKDKNAAHAAYLKQKRLLHKGCTI